MFKNFNAIWNLHSGNVFKSNQDFSIINEKIEPPKDFKLFYKDKQCSFDGMMNGTVYAICGTDPFAGQDGDGSVTWYFTVPCGKSLLKEKSIIDYISLSNGKRTGGDYNDGVMIIGDDSFEKTIDAPYLLQGSQTPDMKL